LRRGGVCSLELRAGIDVALEGAIVDVCAVIVEVGKRGLVHGAVPLDVPWESVAVPVHILVILVIDWSLTSSPLSVRIGNGWVLWQNLADRPVEEIWVVDQSLGVEGVIVEDQRAVSTQATADTPNNEVHDPTVGQPAPHVEVLDGELANDGESEDDASLGPRRIVSPIEIGPVGGARDHAQVVPGEPALEHGVVVLGLGSELKLTLLKDVLADTEANKVAILDVLRNLGIDCSSHAIIKGVL
jgi:hypothetical protein